jgi:hypothetical protein
MRNNPSTFLAVSLNMGEMSQNWSYPKPQRQPSSDTKALDKLCAQRSKSARDILSSHIFDTFWTTKASWVVVNTKTHKNRFDPRILIESGYTNHMKPMLSRPWRSCRRKKNTVSQVPHAESFGVKVVVAQILQLRSPVGIQMIFTGIFKMVGSLGKNLVVTMSYRVFWFNML